MASSRAVRLPAVNLGRLAQPQAAAKVIREILATDPASVSAAAAGEASDLGDELKAAMSTAAARKLTALQAVAPKPPGANTAFAPKEWAPTPTQVRKFAAQSYAAERPIDAMSAVMASGWTPYAADMAQIIREVAPAVWAEAQRQILERIDTLAAKTPAVTRSRLGVLFSLPLTLQQTADYRAAASVANQLLPLP